MSTHLCGLFRGTVIDNVDPQRRQRLRLTIPEFGAEPLKAWILGCLPPGGSVPGIGQQVWVAFEKGDPDNPVWVGIVGGAP